MSDTYNGCRDIDGRCDRCLDSADDEAMVDTDDEEMEVWCYQCGTLSDIILSGRFQEKMTFL